MLQIPHDFSGTIWFSSDFHFDDTALLTPVWTTPAGKQRPFSAIEHMNNCILENINAAVQEDDILFFLGDFWTWDLETIAHHRANIRCKTIHCFVGNIDTHFASYGTIFTSVMQYDQVVFEKYATTAVLFHYPLMVRDKVYAGRIHLHGHTHNRIPNPPGKMMDIGVDTNAFQPYRLEEIIDRMKSKDITLQYGTPRS